MYELSACYDIIKWVHLSKTHPLKCFPTYWSVPALAALIIASLAYK